MKWQPKSIDELYDVIHDIIIKQKNYPDYAYGLRDIDTSLITVMSRLFSCDRDDENSDIINQIDWSDPRNDITLWNVSNVTNMNSMFYQSDFNQPIGNWNVSQVTDINRMFAYSDFNQPLRDWNVSNVTNMSYMFYSSQFNQNISRWDVSSVTDMSGMFAGSPFNQDISNWNVSNVTSMVYMFYSSSFNHNLYTWINRLNENVDLQFFNNNSVHEKVFEHIHNIDDFIEKQLTPQIWLQWYKESNDREKFELLKLLKHRDKKFIETLNQWLKEEKIIDNNIFVENNKM